MSIKNQCRKYLKHRKKSHFVLCVFLAFAQDINDNKKEIRRPSALVRIECNLNAL